MQHLGHAHHYLYSANPFVHLPQWQGQQMLGSGTQNQVPGVVVSDYMTKVGNLSERNIKQYGMPDQVAMNYALTETKFGITPEIAPNFFQSWRAFYNQSSQIAYMRPQTQSDRIEWLKVAQQLTDTQKTMLLQSKGIDLVMVPNPPVMVFGYPAWMWGAGALGFGALYWLYKRR